VQGIYPANSSYITSSLSVVDSTLRETINGHSYWHRYNHDGYGEHADGSDYNGSGVGQLWPLLAGERGLYAVAAGQNADQDLTAMMAVANSSGMIPEQEWGTTAPAEYTPGTPTKSMNPLNWAMGEYITLLFSVSQHKIADIVPITASRYSGQKVERIRRQMCNCML
jgi:glucoamylase